MAKKIFEPRNILRLQKPFFKKVGGTSPQPSGSYGTALGSVFSTSHSLSRDFHIFSVARHLKVAKHAVHENCEIFQIVKNFTEAGVIAISHTLHRKSVILPQ